MIGRKIYYELSTGNVILITLEKPQENAVNTTKNEDFEIYSVLQARTKESVGVIQLEFGEYQSEFQTAKSYKVNLDTNDLQFEYPKYEPPLSEKIRLLENTNNNFKLENIELKKQVNFLGQELAKSKVESIKKDNIINSLGQELTQVKIQLAGGNK